MSTTSATYFTNDRLASLTQGTLTRGYSLDPDWRTRQRSASDTTTQTYHYSDDSDSPSWTVDSTKNNPPYTRNVEGVDGNLVATVVSGTTTLQLADLHGDIVATASTSTSATGPASTMESDEFGVPRSPFSGRYGWLGGKQRRSELPTGAIAMGQRLYIPQLGRFTQTDPVPGGSANAYDYVNQDPLDREGSRRDVRRDRLQAEGCLRCGRVPSGVRRRSQGREDVDMYRQGGVPTSEGPAVPLSRAARTGDRHWLLRGICVSYSEEGS